MLDYILDANVIISILISGKSSYKPFLAFFNFYTPEFSLEEIAKYEQVIFEKSRLDAENLRKYIVSVFEQVTVVPKIALTNSAIEKAAALAEGVDAKDSSYLALALQLDLVLLTRDKPLYHGVRAKGFRKIMLFDDFLRQANAF